MSEDLEKLKNFVEAVDSHGDKFLQLTKQEIKEGVPNVNDMTPKQRKEYFKKLKSRLG